MLNEFESGLVTFRRRGGGGVVSGGVVAGEAVAEDPAVSDGEVPSGDVPADGGTSTMGGNWVSDCVDCKGSCSFCASKSLLLTEGMYAESDCA